MAYIKDGVVKPKDTLFMMSLDNTIADGFSYRDAVDGETYSTTAFERLGDKVLNVNEESNPEYEDNDFIDMDETTSELVKYARSFTFTAQYKPTNKLLHSLVKMSDNGATYDRVKRHLLIVDTFETIDDADLLHPARMLYVACSAQKTFEGTSAVEVDGEMKNTNKMLVGYYNSSTSLFTVSEDQTVIVP